MPGKKYLMAFPSYCIDDINVIGGERIGEFAGARSFGVRFSDEERMTRTEQ